MVASPTGCPGQDARSLTVAELSCPKCAYAIEFFSDERVRTCPQCGERVPRIPSANCAEWCSAAAECEAMRSLS